VEKHADIVAAFGVAAIAEALGVDYDAARKWRSRDSIPPEYWIALSDWTAQQGRPVTLERLALAAKRRWLGEH